MRKFKVSCIWAIGVALFLNSAALATPTVEFNGSGSTNNWSEDANWTNNEKPTTEDVYDVVVDSSSPSVNDVQGLAVRSLELRSESALAVNEDLAVRSLLQPVTQAISLQ